MAARSKKKTGTKPQRKARATKVRSRKARSVKPARTRGKARKATARKRTVTKRRRARPAATARKGATAKTGKLVYAFGGGKADGNAKMKNLLGGKGANLAEMAGLGLPVPPGFTITTEVCTWFYANGRKYPRDLRAAVEKNVRRMEKITGAKFGDRKNPLLLSVRSGARQSMPGMMETILNVGLNDETREALIAKTGNPRFVYDAQRRLIQMYADVVMEKAEGIEPKEGQGIRQQLERELQAMKKRRGVTEDTDLDADDLHDLVDVYKTKVCEVLGTPFPEKAIDQLWGAVGAVFLSWQGKRAREYRRIERIPGEWGTAVNVQAMVFGNMGDSSGTGVGFTRDPATGERAFYGEWLPNAQGEDVVAGTRTPRPISEAMRKAQESRLPSLEREMPKVYRELEKIQKKLERHYGDMLDVEFTIQEERLWMLQCRVGKRTGAAAIRIAVEMAREKLIDRKTAVRRVPADALVQVLLPQLDPDEERKARFLAKGLPAGPGGATGRIALTADEAVRLRDEAREKARRARAAGRADEATRLEDDGRVILVREETNPEDVHGMHAAAAILTARGGMTSHAALVARGWGKCCIVGCDAIEIDLERGEIHVAGETLRPGDWISLNGTAGKVYEGRLPLRAADPDKNRDYRDLMTWADSFRKLGVRTNADTPADAKRALAFGAEGIGLFRTEHMFYGEGSAEPLEKLRKVIVASDTDERKRALDELFPFVKRDIKATLEVMTGKPVTIRLLDPPLHEFIPDDAEGLRRLALSLGKDVETVRRRAAALEETNPMMGHRGVRLGVSYPEMTAMQVRAIFEAAAELDAAGKKALPEIMIPVVSTPNELADQYALVERVHDEVRKAKGVRKIPHQVGTMIEIPRAVLQAAEIAGHADFFSFGTNDLTQLSFGFSRDDTGSFLPRYLEKKLLPDDPFESLDTAGVGELVRIGVERGRKAKPKLKIGICGEHGGDARSVVFFHEVGLDYVSCSPFRVPVARLAAAQAALG